MAATSFIGQVLRRPCISFFQTTVSSSLIPPASCACVQQKRHRTPRFVLRPSTRKVWWTRKWTLKSDDGLTSENEAFVKDVITDKYASQSPLKEEPWPRNQFKPFTRRTGVLALKLGVLKQWDKTGRPFSVTLLQVLDNHVINYIPPEQYKLYPSHRPHQYDKFGLQIVGALSCDPRQFSKAYNGLFVKAGVPPKRWLTRFLVTPDAAVEPGTSLSVNHFRVGDYIDCQSRTRDWGFQGVMKRWGMKGMPASHGVTKSHRKMGSTGGGGDKSNIWRGKHMPGIMGNKLSNQAGLKIWRINTKYNVLYVHGHGVAGRPHTFVRIRDSYLPRRRLNPEKNADVPPMPTWYPEDAEADPLPEEIFHEDLFQFTNPSIVGEESAV